MLDEYLAAQIAYGHAGVVLDELPNRLLTCRSYFMMRSIQQLFSGQAPTRIAYWNGAHFLSTSKAIQAGIHEQAQLYVLYPNQLEIWINGHPTSSWEVRVGREKWRLPSFGWVAQAPGFLELSVEVEGRRLDYVQTSDSIYYDGRGRTAPFRQIASEKPIVIRALQGDPPMIEVLNIDRVAAFALGELPFVQGRPVHCQLYGERGKELEALPVTTRDGLYWFERPRGAFRYVITYRE